MKNIKKLLFKNWLVEDLQYGRFGGRSLNNAPREYLQWMLKQIDTGSTFSGMVTDNGRNVPVERIKKEIENILGIRPQPQQAQPRQAQPQQPQPRQAATAGRVGVTNWLYGKTKIARPDLGIPVADLDIAAKKTNENNFTFVILDLQERKLVSKGTIPKDEIQDVLKSVKTPQNEVITANKPSDFFDILNPKTVATGKGNIIPEGRITEEQKAIDAKFEQILKTPEQNHIMINALAGSGKTTMLKHLAWKYGKGKKWLYLVFNAKNKEEAQGEFPSSVQIETTNGWAGREVLEKNNIKQTDRIQKYSFSDKAKMVADSQSFERYMDSLGMPSQNKVYGTNINSMSGTEKAMYFLLRKINNEFKSEAVKLLGLVKAFAVDPRKSDLQEKIKEVLDKYDINTNLESSKDYIEKNMPWAKDKLEDIYNQDFMNSDFTKELIQATNWLLQQSLPHETEEEIEAEKKQFKGQKIKLGHVRDFDDDLWYSAIHADELVWPKYEVVLADEVQDFNVAQRIILQKLAEQGAKIVAVGDPNQCHPAGTMIALTGGNEKPIEEIQVGDQVVTYNTKKSYFPGVTSQGRKVEEVSCREYVGEMINIKTKTSSVRCTPNHKCLVKLDAKNKYCLYLMLKGQTARVGICRANYPNGFGLTIRAIQEQADKAWLLNIFDTEREARLAEIVTSAEFGLPQMVFENKGQLFPSQDFINEVYDSIGSNLEKAKNCLFSFGRDFDYPIWNKEQQERFGLLKKNYIGSKKSFITQACNLISGFMQVRTFDGTNRGGEWESIVVNKEADKCKVYSLKVEPTEDGKRLYIANGVVVHNSIYRFRGADSNAFSQLKQTLQDASKNKDVEQQLTANFRSRQAIIDLANREGEEAGHVSNLKKGREFASGPGKLGEGKATTYELNYEDAFNNLKDEKTKMGELMRQTAFISRTNEPLVHASLRLMKEGIPFVILGKDLVEDITKHIDKIIGLFKLTKDTDVDVLQEKLETYQEEQIEKFGDKTAKAGVLKELKETTDAMLSALEQFIQENEQGSIYQFKQWLASKFGGIDIEKAEGKKELDKKIKELNPVILTTVHKSKGLQFSRVYILRDDLWPHPRAKRQEDLEQEMNNKYIGRTRAEDELHILDLKGQPGYKDEQE